MLLALIMLAGIMPLSAISVDAYQVTTDRFEAAYNWALGYANRAESVGSTAYAALVGKALNANSFSGMSETGTDALYKNIEALAGVEIFNTSSTGDLNNTDYFIVTNRVDFIAFWHNGMYVYNSSGSGCPKAQSTVTWTYFDRAYRLKETKNFDDSEDIGDNFCAYINVVGCEGYAGQHSKTLSYHRSNNNVYATTPIYADTTDQNNTRQIWKFRKHYINGVWDGYYSIENYASPGWYLNVMDGDIDYSAGNTNIVISNWFSTRDENDKSSLWQLVKNSTISDRQCYYLKPKNNLNDDGSIIEKPVALNIDVGGDGDDAHLWGDFITDGSSRFYIYKINEVTDGLNAVINCVKNGDTRVAVDTSDNNDVEFQTNASLTAEVSKQNQQVWIFERQNKDAYPPIYKIKNRLTGTYLQVAGSVQGSSPINVGADSGVDAMNQKWILLGDDINSLNFISLVDNTDSDKARNNSFAQGSGDIAWTYLSMDAPSGQAGNGQTINTWVNNLDDAQRFKLSRYWVDNGDFYSAIKSDLGSGYVLSLSMDGINTGKDKNTNVVLRQYIYEVVDQTWYFRSLGDGTYVIQNLANGYYLDVPGENLDNGISAYNEYNGNNNQRWYIVQEPNGNYSICSKLNFNKTIDIPSAALTGNEQNNLWFYDNNQTKAQTWQLDFESKTSPPWGENLGDTFWAYISPSDNSKQFIQCNSSENGKYTTLAECNTDEAKRKQENYWKFERKEDGSYLISSCCLANQKLTRIDDTEALLRENHEVGTYANTDKYEQRWFIRKYSGGYRIESKNNGQVIGYEGTALKTYEKELTDSTQLFNIIETDLAIDSDTPNVKMHLFNYGNAINDISKVKSIYEGSSVLSFFQSAYGDECDDSVDGKDFNGYYDGDYIPLMSKKLGTDGFPAVEKYVNPRSTNEGQVETGSLKYLFDPEMGKNNNGFVAGSGSQTSYDTSAATVSYQSQHFTVNNPTSLFKKNPKTGLYYYDSLLNAAYFQRDKDSSGKELTSGNFNLYDYTERRFHNEYKTGLDTTTGLNTTSGHFFPFNMGHVSGDVDYGGGTRPTIETSNPYVTTNALVPVDYKFKQSTKVDTWFGMSLECEFQQTSDGTYNGQDMIFQFKGDDDVWVYIDDVLVLDIGGAHTPRAASVNFRTGAVTYPGRDASTGTVSGTVNTNLRTLFESANESTANFNESGETNTFKSDSKHNLKFFILERGGSDSYFQLMFNLPKGTPSVTKEVDHSDPDFNDKRDYKFKIEQAIPAGNDTYTYQNFSDVTYLLEGDDGTSVDNNELTDGCFFTLKPGQTAYFHNIDDGTQYIVSEIYNTGTSKTTAQYTKSLLDNSGNRVTVDEKGNRVAVDDNGDVVTDENGYVVKVDSDGKLMTDESGKYQTYDYTLTEFTDTKDREMGRYRLETNVEQNIKFTNTLKTTGLDVSEKVYVYNNDTDKWEAVDSVPNAVYNFGLLLYTENDDGTIEEYSRKSFSIPGDDLANGLVIENLPVGVLYKLWEYNPIDDEAHRYVPPAFTDLYSGKSVTGSFVKAGGTAEDSDGISGEVVGDKIYVKVTNKYALRKNVVFVKTDNKQSVDVGETVNYTITSEVPDTTGFTDYTYLITDTMSSGLTFNKNVKVTIGSTDATSACTIAYDVGGDANKFTVSVPVMDYSFGDAITVTYSAAVNANAAAQIENNSATLTYSNAVGSTATTASSTTQVYSAKIVIDKYSADTSAKLSGAEFYMYKLDGSAKKYYKSDANGVSWVDVQASATKMTTDSNGAASFDGVADGTYYLEEVKAPDGYSRLTQATSVTVNGGGDNPVAANLTVKAEIPNYTGPELPESGGMTTTFLLLVGGLTALGAAVFLVAKRRTNKNTL